MQIRTLMLVLFQIAMLPALAQIQPKPQPRQPGTVFRDCPSCPEMIVVPSGEFRMGLGKGGGEIQASESPRHTVTIGYAFAVGRFEITRVQFAEFLSDSGYSLSSAKNCNFLNPHELQWADDDDSKTWREPGFEQGDDHPAICVSWADAKAYVSWLSRHTGKTYRLLSEAEWEYAARAGSERLRPWGDNENDACRHANVWDETFMNKQGIPRQPPRGVETFAMKGAPRFRDEVRDPMNPKKSAWYLEHHWCKDDYAHTAPVGKYPSNQFGLHDVIGNVWEWVEDCFNSSYNSAPTDGSTWQSGNCDVRVIRGGSWASVAHDAQSARRFFRATSFRSVDVGFRIARGL